MELAVPAYTYDLTGTAYDDLKPQFHFNIQVRDNACKVIEELIKCHLYKATNYVVEWGNGFKNLYVQTTLNMIGRCLFCLPCLM